MHGGVDDTLLSSLIDDASFPDLSFLNAETMPVEPTEEFRQDRGALISRKEVFDLVEDASSSTEKTPGRFSSTTLGDASAILNPKQLDALVPIASRDPNEDNAQYLFNADQMDRLRRQQQQNMQILIQSYMLEWELRGSKSSTATQLASQLVSLVQFFIV